MISRCDVSCMAHCAAVADCVCRWYCRLRRCSFVRTDFRLRVGRRQRPVPRGQYSRASVFGQGIPARVPPCVVIWPAAVLCSLLLLCSLCEVGGRPVPTSVSLCVCAIAARRHHRPLPVRVWSAGRRARNGHRRFRHRGRPVRFAVCACMRLLAATLCLPAPFALLPPLFGPTVRALSLLTRRALVHGLAGTSRACSASASIWTACQANTTTGTSAVCVSPFLLF